MATIGSYFLNGPNLATSTGIYMEVGLITCAPVGFYSQGGIVRELDDRCILLSAQLCPSCSTSCGGTTINGPSEIRMYLIPMELGSTIGAVKVSFDPINVPEGIRAIYNNIVYNGFSSEVDGYHQTTVLNGLTYMGNTVNEGTLLTGSPYGALPEESYYDGAFSANGNTTTVTVDAGSISLTTAATPGECIVYIPKTSNSPTTLSLEVAELLASGTAITWELNVGCPTELLGLNCTTPKGGIDCTTSESLDETMYLGKVSGDVNLPIKYDWAFEDKNAAVKKAEGDYVVEDINLNKWAVSVDSNGLIATVVSCSNVCTNLSLNGGTILGVFFIPIGLGTVLGAIKIKFYPGDVADGIRTEYNSVFFNEFSSEIDGYHRATSSNNDLTYMGNSSSSTGLVATHNNITEYDYVSGAFVARSPDVSVTVTTNETSLSASTPNACIAYIPRTDITLTELDIKISTVLPSAPQNNWSISIECPTPLLKLLSTDEKPGRDCDDVEPFGEVMYLGKVSGAYDEPVVYDWAFADANSSAKRAAGDYLVQNESLGEWAITIDANGLISSVTSCKVTCSPLSITGGTAIGSYLIYMPLGEVRGAVKVTFYPGDFPKGIWLSTSSRTVFNKFSSASAGYLSSHNHTDPIYMGNDDDDAGLIASHSSITEYEYDASTNSFAANGNTNTVNVISADLALTSSASPGACITYIPSEKEKSALTIWINSLLSGTDSWSIDVDCPKLLLPLSCTSVNPTNPCDVSGPYPNILYLGKVSGAENVPVVHDWAFADDDSETKLAMGTYGIRNTTSGTQWSIVVGSSGTITSVTTCNQP